MTHPPTTRRRLGKIVALMLGLGVGLAATEIAARVWLASQPKSEPMIQRFHPFLGYAFQPNRAITLQDSFGSRDYSTNSLGLRGRDAPRRKPPNAFRIICVGGSTTENAYVGDDQTYPAQLERLLRARCPGVNIEVLNAGFSAYSTAHTLINYQLNLVEFEPDLLIVYQAINDLMPMSYPGFQPDYSNFYTIYHLSRVVRTDLYKRVQWPQWVGTWVLGKLAIFAQRAMMHWRYTGPRPTRKTKLATVPGDALQVYERNMRHLVQLAKADRVHVCLATFAHPMKPVMGRDALDRLRRFPWFHHLNPSGVCDALDRMNHVVRDLAKSQGTLFVDQERLMPKDFDTFLDCCHMRAPGLQMLAQHFADAIVASGIIQSKLK